MTNPQLDITDDEFARILARHLAPWNAVIEQHREEAETARAQPRPKLPPPPLLPSTPSSTSPPLLTAPGAARQLREPADTGRLVWHPRADGAARYLNIWTTENERRRYGLFYDQYGQLRERRETSTREVSRCWPGCGRMWTDPREAHCFACHQHFGGDDAHARHLVTDPIDEHTCREPNTIGRLILVERKFDSTWVKVLDAQLAAKRANSRPK